MDSALVSKRLATPELKCSYIYCSHNGFSESDAEFLTVSQVVKWHIFELLPLRFNKFCAIWKRSNKLFITVFFDGEVDHELNTWATTSRISLCFNKFCAIWKTFNKLFITLFCDQAVDLENAWVTTS